MFAMRAREDMPPAAVGDEVKIIFGGGIKGGSDCLESRRIYWAGR